MSYWPRTVCIWYQFKTIIIIKNNQLISIQLDVQWPDKDLLIFLIKYKKTLKFVVVKNKIKKNNSIEVLIIRKMIIFLLSGHYDRMNLIIRRGSFNLITTFFLFFSSGQ